MKGGIASIIVIFSTLFLSIRADCPDGFSGLSGHDPWTQHVQGDKDYKIEYDLCNTLPGVCTIGDDVCMDKENCCMFCQQWEPFKDDDGVCLATSFQKSSKDGGNIVLHFDGGTPVNGDNPGDREVQVTVSCGTSEWEWTGYSDGAQHYSGDVYTYEITASSKYVCKDGEPVTPTPGGGKNNNKDKESGIGGGGLFLLFLFLAAAVYLIGGALFMKFKRQEEGIDIIPNREFWLETPALFKEGVGFTVNKVKSLFGKGDYDEY